MKSDLFYYNLPKSFIAQKPLKKRDESRLLVLEKKSGHITHDRFKNLPLYLEKNSILVINRSSVNRCRVFAEKEGMEREIECFILHRIEGDEFLALVRPSKKLKEYDVLSVGKYRLRVVKNLGKGKAVLSIEGDIKELFREHGNIPLPPYIKSKDIREEQYQTIFAKYNGSTAAPTAGLHFTENLVDRLKAKGIDIAETVLHIGVDTFRPIREVDIEDHKMHSEYYSIEREDADRLNEARRKNKKIIAVGTTTTRVLETVYDQNKGFSKKDGWTDLYIRPGYDFKAIDGMVTNFHLPMTTLIVMVSAFAGRELLLNTYEEAKEKGYRFFSFGDGMLII